MSQGRDLITKRFYHNGFKVVVKCKEDKGALVPLSFDVYYNSTKINWKLTPRQARDFEAAIYEQLNYRSIYKDH